MAKAGQIAAHEWCLRAEVQLLPNTERQIVMKDTYGFMQLAQHCVARFRGSTGIHWCCSARALCCTV